MPIKSTEIWPAKRFWRKKTYSFMDGDKAIGQGIRPLEILILNLMPLKGRNRDPAYAGIVQYTPQVDCTFLMLSPHVSKTRQPAHLNKILCYIR